ncbi:hypothetical protein ElyMa_003302800 [Elysia marginata]|uniref:FZ domain-containing protein n=1 Tax=Elysia marginata TaxID=1093978 RepID=A0AAV4JH93_9GAST|nr:hypothetical protein ElyMa_003302800 [Elysia marginata]
MTAIGFPRFFAHSAYLFAITFTLLLIITQTVADTEDCKANCLALYPYCPSIGPEAHDAMWAGSDAWGGMNHLMEEDCASQVRICEQSCHN